MHYRGWEIKPDVMTAGKWFRCEKLDGSGSIEVTMTEGAAMCLIDRLEGVVPKVGLRNFCRHPERCDGSSCREEIACND